MTEKEKQLLKEFFNKSEVEKAVQNNDFDTVYASWEEMMLKYDLFDCSNFLTNIFSSININPLNYMTAVAPYMFYKLNISNINIIPDNIKIIKHDGFLRCDTPLTIIIPSSVVYIESAAFEDCEFLENIIIPPSVKKLGDYVFADCLSLKNIKVPSSCEIGKYTFDRCPAATKIEQY
jgi:hypothetical protein